MIELGPVLFVHTPGVALSIEGDAVRARFPDGTWRRLPLARVDSLVLFGHVHVTTELLCRCAADGIPVAFLTTGGRPRAVVHGTAGRNGTARHAQHLAHTDRNHRNTLAAQFVIGKTDNQRAVLLRLTGAGPRRAATAVAELGRRADALDPDGQRTRLRLMGLEGAAARLYFRHLFAAVSPHADLPAPARRERRPCTDPFNAALSFSYGLLASAVHGAVAASGLDPDLGLLHGDRPEQPGLVLDLMEEFRPAVDRWLLTLVNRRQLRRGHFDEHVSGAVTLTETGRKEMVGAWHELRADPSPSVMLGGAPAPFAAQPLLQARALSRVLTRDAAAYVPWSLP